jgi:hypothetical protein
VLVLLDGAQGRPLGDCVKAIEDNLPSVPGPDGTSTLPSLLRRAEREAKMATSLLTADSAVVSPSATASPELASSSSSSSSTTSSSSGSGDSGGQWVGSNIPVAVPVSDSAMSAATSTTTAQGVSTPAAKPPVAAGPAGRAAEVKARLLEVEARLAELDKLSSKDGSN